MFLLLDIGNSRLKYGFSNGLELVHDGAIDLADDPLSTLGGLVTRAPLTIRDCYIASVGSAEMNAQVSIFFEQQTGLTPIFLKTQQFQCGVENAYNQPEQLGIDRWLGLIGARERNPQACLVVSLGTAMTLDLLDSNGRHLGGYILPGLQLMRNSLLQSTQQISFAESSEVGMRPGKTTAECVVNASLLASVAIIEKVFTDFSKTQTSKPVCLLTGGNAECVGGQLNIEAESVPSLLFEGMLKVISEIRP